MRTALLVECRADGYGRLAQLAQVVATVWVRCVGIVAIVVTETLTVMEMTTSFASSEMKGLSTDPVHVLRVHLDQVQTR
jgi:hypothetical protein